MYIGLIGLILLPTGAYLIIASCTIASEQLSIDCTMVAGYRVAKLHCINETMMSSIDVVGAALLCFSCNSNVTSSCFDVTSIRDDDDSPLVDVKHGCTWCVKAEILTGKCLMPAL